MLAVLLISVAILFAAVECRTHSKCYGSLGCFTFDSHMPLPQDPSVIRARTNLYDRQHTHTASASVSAEQFDSEIRTFGQRFDASKPTKVIIHGFMDQPSTAWIGQTRDALLQKGDFNVMVVDWSHGNRPDYNQAVTNTFIVGAEIAYLLKYLHDHYSLNLADVHLIGHSLGAQVSAHIGTRARTIGRITGLDPADPGFTGHDVSQRLDKSDAAFVDVIHTDSSRFLGVSGFGTKEAVGHMDFYPNGGQHQPGCEDHVISGAIHNILHGSFSGAAQSVTCSHSRAPLLFIESLKSSCSFKAHQCSSFNTFDAGQCLGCPSGGCPLMGYDANKSSLRGSFFLSTTGSQPFCGQEFFVEIHASHVMDNTYGQIYVTLIGSNGQSEELEFSRTDEFYRHDKIEKRVIATHNNIGTIQSVKVRFAEGHHFGRLDNEIQLYSINIKAADGSSQTKICGHDAHIHDAHTMELHSHSGC